jgi:hypothetical protein
MGKLEASTDSFVVCRDATMVGIKTPADPIDSSCPYLKRLLPVSQSDFGSGCQSDERCG